MAASFLKRNVDLRLFISQKLKSWKKWTKTSFVWIHILNLILYIRLSFTGLFTLIIISFETTCNVYCFNKLNWIHFRFLPPFRCSQQFISKLKTQLSSFIFLQRFVFHLLSLNKFRWERNAIKGLIKVEHFSSFGEIFFI